MSNLSLQSLIIYITISLLFFWLLVGWWNYLVNNNYVIDLIKKHSVKEGFNPNQLIDYDTNNPAYSHSVDLPINTTLSCSNFCGPKAQCAITREQCTADIDCTGCQPEIPPPPAYLTETDILPYNEAGRMIYNQNPQYSVLTTDIGTKAYPINKDAKVPQPYLGLDVWTEAYDKGTQLFDKKMAWKYSAAPEKFRFMPEYPTTETATGLFEDTGPTAANAYLKGGK
jgi:hypothetical protein